MSGLKGTADRGTVMAEKIQVLKLVMVMVVLVMMMIDEGCFGESPLYRDPIRRV